MSTTQAQTTKTRKFTKRDANRINKAIEQLRTFAHTGSVVDAAKLDRAAMAWITKAAAEAIIERTAS